ncbi:MAG: hypothetical protein WCO56_07525 [Verrucomicrobiota bacterium]
MRTKLYLILGVAFITYGLARGQILSSVLSKQESCLEEYCKVQAKEFYASHANDSSHPTNWCMPPELNRLRKGILLAGGTYPGWPQAIFPCAAGLMLLATSYYFGQKKTVSKDESNT